MFVYGVLCLFVVLFVCSKDEGWLVYSDLVHCLEHWLHYSWQARVPLPHSRDKIEIIQSESIGGKLKVSKESESIQRKRESESHQG